MVPIGFYSFRNHVQAYRSDYCAACGNEVLAQRVQGLLWLSLFAIPVLPMGRCEHWKCLACGRSRICGFPTARNGCST